MKRKLFKSMCLAMLLAAFAGCGTEKNSVGSLYNEIAHLKN